MSAIDRFFSIADRGSTVRTELLGGVTTFVTMAYIIVVNPAILSFAGLPVGASTVATIVIAIFGSLLMGLYARLPIAVAPYMGENAFIAFGLAALGISWQQRLGAVFVSGVAFLAITLLGVRRWLAESISPSLKHSFAVGIGLFLSLIGLYEAGFVASSVTGLPAAALLAPGGELLRAPEVPLKIGDLTRPETLLALFGLATTLLLWLRRVRGSLFLGIAATAALGIALGFGEAPRGFVALPFAGEYSLAPIAFKLDLAGVLSAAFFPVLLTLFLMGFLDTLGTLVAVGAAGGMLDERGNLPRIERPMAVDAVACMASGLVGTSTSGAYIESATGIREGARTGLAAVVTAGLFAAALCFLPLIEPLQKMRYAYAPALIVVGLLMIGAARKIDFEDPTELVPAFLTLAMMVFTYNIANGLTAGLIAAPLAKLAAGRWREVRPGAAVLGLACLGYYLFGLPH